LDDNVFIEKLLPGAVVRGLTEAEMAHYRAPFVERAARKPVLAWPREIPIEGQPADVTAIVSAYRDALCRSPLPKLLLTVDPAGFTATVGAYRAGLCRTPLPKLLLTFAPGGLVPAPAVEWCRASLPNLEIVPLGEGRHYVQEDHPHEMGRAIAAWLERVRRG